ncbi:MAG TPA: hypothetical protein ENI31_00780 [Candidatus Omnitrophica bacterium]|nr:MAG: hypothetical protein DRP61_00265 [Candidatus Omnitrophota bacterium]RKY44907.1 MAG: hypothetical protein DRP80_00930 [Candidatus Omnitrophota bacterium]HEC68812.1 hypothetical protein [Candidatus Omnitrophota bacterium]
MLSQKEIKLLGVLFFLYIFQYLDLPQFWEIDFFLLGVLSIAYFLDYYLFLSAVSLTLLLNYFFTKDFFLFLGLIYLVFPLIVKKLSSVFNLSFLKHLVLVSVFFLFYVSIQILFFKVFSFKNFLYILLKNLTALLLIGLILEYGFVFKKS